MITLAQEDFLNYSHSHAGYCRFCNEITEDSGVDEDAESEICLQCNKQGLMSMNTALMLGKLEIES